MDTSNRGIRFARRVYLGAAIYGIAALLPQYFMAERLGRDYPPALTHTEYFYGFIGVALAWQLAFILIGRDPARYRPMMPVTFVEKLTFGVATIILFAQGKLAIMMLGAGVIDLVLCTLFVLSYRATRDAT